MRIRWTVLAIASVVCLGAVGITVLAKDADEEKVSLDQVPPAVKATILKEAQGGTIQEIERETKKGKTVYEAEVMIGGKEVEIKVAPDGTLIKKEIEGEEEEEVISLDQVPEAARNALLKHAGGAKIIKVEREKEHGAVVYEAEWEVGGLKHEAEVTADGDLMELEEKVGAEDVPAAVRKAAEKRFPAGSKVEYEKKTITLYEIKAEVNGKKREVLLTPAGKAVIAVHD
ncbi:MAG: PepSY-like domain-containing protein [Phycisphaerae bacterium]|nr:PepSY-like domain-containing protein [Phycisphaerae bacterium]